MFKLKKDLKIKNDPNSLSFGEGWGEAL